MSKGPNYKIRANLPKDFALQMSGDQFALFATIETQQQMEAVTSVLMLFHQRLPATRAAVAGDFGIPEKQPKSHRQTLIDAGLMQ
jgi:hypothetical protein